MEVDDDPLRLNFDKLVEESFGKKGSPQQVAHWKKTASELANKVEHLQKVNKRIKKIQADIEELGRNSIPS
eukprot:8005280-Karenia_brevis.AAC.1